MGKNYYTIYLNSTDEIVALGSALECAKMLNRSLASFYCTVNRNRSGKHKKYTIVTDPFCGEDDEDMETV